MTAHKKDRRQGCERCGIPHDRCYGHNKAGKPCGRRPAVDQDVCKLHGGASPAALAKAREKAVERAAAAELRQRWQAGDERPIEDPLTELARLAGEAVAFKDYLRAQVDELDGALTYWTERTFVAGDDEIRTEAVENLRATVTAYERALDRTAKILAAIVKLDLAGRMLEVNRQKATLITDAVRYGLAQVDMPAEIRRATQEAIADAIAGLSTTARPREIERAG